MGANISLFSGYNTKENRLTNYCMLVLKTLYDNNPKYLGEFLSSINENLSGLVGVKFTQQEKKKSSIPDGFISQDSFVIYIETKNYDWFYDSQLEAHLTALNKEKNGKKFLIALGNFESTPQNKFDRIKGICRETYKDSIFFTALSFEDFINTCQSLTGLTKDLIDIISEFREYLDESNLLDTWVRKLDVINCASYYEEILQGHIYMCPAMDGAYSHERCKYFGMYKDKKVSKIAEILAVVDLDSPTVSKIKWKNDDKNDKEHKDYAIKKHFEWRANDYPTRVFILGCLHNTSFNKTSKGGMIGSKRYFDISNLNTKTAEELAKKQQDKAWPMDSALVK